MVLCYLSGPIIHGDLRKDDFYKTVVATLEKKCVEVFAPQFLSGVGPAEVYGRDVEKVRECDFLVAEVSNPSLGVGMEIMLAIELAKPIILFRSRDSKPLSFMVRGSPGNVLFEYSLVDEVGEILSGIETDSIVLRTCPECPSYVASKVNESYRCLGCSKMSR